MKKNRMMRLASVMLVLVLLTSSVVGGTFAKYTTKGEATDSARVAKFGVNVTAKTDADNTLFTNTYDETGSVTVKADVAVVAPGTSGNMSHFVITGTPEVAVEVKYNATLTLTDWVVAGDDYCPIIITVNGTKYQDSTMAGLKTKVEEAINAYTNKYDANVDLSAQTGNDLIVSWSWPFDGDNDKDTALGNKVVADDTPTIKLDITCTVNQVD